MFTAIIQARTGATRLPNKILLKINGKPLLWYLISRLKRVNQLSKLLVATTTQERDDIIEQYCGEWGIGCFRGNEYDVLDRYYKAARESKSENIVRIAADRPLIDFRLVDEVISCFQGGNVDYISNSLRRTYPVGMDVEIFNISVLEKAWKEALMKSEREHVTPYIWKNSTYHGKSIFRSSNVSFEADFSHFRLTVDYKEDFEVIQFLIEHTDLDASWLTYVSVLTQNLDIMGKNSMFRSDEGYERSLLRDKEMVGNE